MAFDDCKEDKAERYPCKCGGNIKKDPESSCWTCDTCDFSKREMEKAPVLKCYYCKRKIYPGEITATVQAQIGEWTGAPHTICRNCAEGLGATTDK
jgi:ribosomal protein L24E